MVSLGCARNQIDSEVMLAQLIKTDWSLTHDPSRADAIVINTCSFIESAANESIETILELAKFKITGQCKRLVVAGCLPERYREDIMASLPEVDVFLGAGAFDRIAAVIRETPPRSKCILPDPDTIPLQPHKERRLLSPPHTAYLKITEGCSRHCTYCIIPKLRGRQKSLPMEDILAEAERLLSTGVKELVLVGQETTGYGIELKPPEKLEQLLSNLARLSENHWVRLMYGHPESISNGVIKTIAGTPNICSYLDIPIQHASNTVLKRMGRNYTSKTLHKLFDTIRAEIPDVSLRTTVMVGFPGETDLDFKHLSGFVESLRFDHLGVFVYSDAEDLAAYGLPTKVPPEVAQKRYEQLMARQQVIASENNRRHLGKTYTVLLEEKVEDNLYLGRTRFQAPEVDGVTYVHVNGAENIHIGGFIPATIADTLEYDLIGESG